MEWRLLVLRPIVLLVWLNAGAATACFGLALLWLIQGYWYTYIQWELALIVVGGFSSLAAFAGSLVSQMPPRRAVEPADAPFSSERGTGERVERLS